MRWQMILWILASISSLLAFHTELLKCKELYDRVNKCRGYFIKKWYTRKRRLYNETLSSADFLKWQKETLLEIYRPLVNALKENMEINITNIELENEHYEYESVTIRFESIPYPFKKLCDKEKLVIHLGKDLTNFENDITVNYKKLVKKYRNLVYYTIKFPKRLGYMLNGLKISCDGKKLYYLSAYSGIYEHTLLESHILEYELYLSYRKYVSRRGEGVRQKAIEELTIRNQIHEKFLKEGNESNILISGNYRASLLGVQVFTIVKNCVGTYDVLRIRRSDNVASKVGFLQFIPSGGFEAYNNDLSFDSQWENYSINKVVFRELLEECFGLDEENEKIDKESPDKIYFNKNIEKILSNLNGNGKRMVFLEFMGLAVSLVELRTELCFILKIDDPDFTKQIMGNDECEQAVHLIRIDEIERERFWRCDERNDLELLNPTSAALWELARTNRHYINALNMTRDIIGERIE